MADRYKGRKYEVAEYDKNWPATFESERKILKAIFGEDAEAIEHVGSTAVPDLSGKPTIDVLVLLGSLSVADAYAGHMVTAGYKDMGEYVAEGTRLFVKEADNTRLVNVHIYPQGHSHAKDMLLFRDYLRNHPEEVRKYGDLKQELHKKYPDDYGAYRKEKDEYLTKLMERAQSARST